MPRRQDVGVSVEKSQRQRIGPLSGITRDVTSEIIACPRYVPFFSANNDCDDKINSAGNQMPRDENVDVIVT